ncbi:MAG: PKD domain-containing protein, partial [Chryseolinea sp.]
GRVVELRGEFGENGKSEYYYTSVYKSELDGNTEFIDLTVSQPPFGSPEEDNDWKRGQLVNKIDYKYQLGSFIKIHETINTYQVLGSEIIATGFKAFMTFNDDECKSGDQRVFANSWKIKKGNLSYVPYYTIEKNYNTDGVTYSETRTDFTFNEGNRQLAESIVTFNNNAAMPWKRSTKLKYPSDYTFSSATAYNMALALSNMANVKHIHNAVIEKQIWEIQNGSNKLIDAEINLYKANGVELDKQMKLQTQIPLTVYTPSYLDVSNNFVYESSKFRELVSYNLYDNLTGNILEATGSDGIKRSFLWGYQNIYPIAEAINASNDNICYTSFEESTVGGWAINPSAPLLSGNAKTGSQYFIGSVETNSTLVVGIYNVSFWAKGTGDIIINGSTLPVNSTDWAYYSRSISLPSSSKVYFNSNSIPIDELRVYPNAAQMKTFTYSPLVGQTSVTDYNSTSTNYLYDDFNRLKSVSDNKASILKTLTYNQKGYSGPPPPSSLIASFSVTGTKKTGKTLTFTPVNTVSGVSYLWDFGDGMTLSSQNPSETHIYTAPGIYIVQLTVSKGTDSNNSQKSLEINIPVITDPNWPGPELTVNILPFFSPGHPLNGQLKVNVSATAAAGGQQPYKEYRWLIHSRDGSFESLGVCSVYIDGVGIVGCEDGEIVTTSPNASFILPQVQSEQIVTGLPPYSIISRVVGANDIASQATNSLGH